MAQVGKGSEQESCLIAWLEVEERARHWQRLGGSQETGKQQMTQGCAGDGGKSGGVLGWSQGRHGCLMWASEDGKEAGRVGHALVLQCFLCLLQPQQSFDGCVYL